MENSWKILAFVSDLHDWIFGAGSFIAVQFNTHLRSTWEQPTYFCRGWRSVSIRPGRWRPPGPPSTGCASRLSNMQFDTQFRCVSQTEQGEVVGTDLDSSRALRTVSRSSWEQHVLHSAVEVLESDANWSPLPYSTPLHSHCVATSCDYSSSPTSTWCFISIPPPPRTFHLLDPPRSGIRWE